MSIAISVIVPVFNSESYLEDCLFSIQRQTFTNFEVLIIDNSSSDNSLEICKRFLREDSRFKIFTNLKPGLSETRNVGLDHAQGEYISFIDSDDIVSPFFLEKLYSLAIEQGAEVVSCSMLKMSRPRSNNGSLTELKSTVSPVILKSHQIYEMIFSLNRVRCSAIQQGGFVCNKLFKQSLISGSRFTTTKGAEDELFLFFLVDRISRFVSVGLPLYIYRQREDSLSNSKRYIFELIKSREYLVRNSQTNDQRVYAQLGLVKSAISLLKLFIFSSENSRDMGARFLILKKQTYFSYCSYQLCKLYISRYFGFYSYFLLRLMHEVNSRYSLRIFIILIYILRYSGISYLRQFLKKILY